MREITFSDYSYKLADIPEPRIRTSKEWRRYQVMMKRLQRRLDEHIMRSIYGDPFGGNRPPESYPPKPERRRYYGALNIVNMS